MNSMKNKLWAGTVAAALLLGGFGGLVTQQAYADDDDDSSTISAPAPVDTSIPLAKRFKLDWSEVEGNASAALGMDWIDLDDALKAGSSIMDVASAKGVSGEGITNQLVQKESVQVTEALESSKITQEEADRLNKQIEAKVQTIINKKGYQYQAKSSEGKPKQLKLGVKFKAAELAGLLGMDKAEVKQQLAAGKTLADIAAAKGMTEEQLLDKLSETLKPDLASWIHQQVN